jgi:hypothetical protein
MLAKIYDTRMTTGMRPAIRASGFYRSDQADDQANPDDEFFSTSCRAGQAHYADAALGATV